MWRGQIFPMAEAAGVTAPGAAPPDGPRRSRQLSNLSLEHLGAPAGRDHRAERERDEQRDSDQEPARPQRS